MGNPTKKAKPAAEQAQPAQAAAEEVSASAVESTALESAPAEVSAEAEAAAAAMQQKPQQPQAHEPKAEIEPLEQFLRRIEVAHIARDVVATAATHPHATERVWPGTYGGIRLSQGPASVTYSDGATE